MLTLKSIKGKDAPHKKAFTIGNLVLKKKDRGKVIELLSNIREKENIAAKLKKPSYNTQVILETKITFEYQGQDVERRTVTLAYYAICNENKQAFDDLLYEAIKQKLLKNVLNEEMIIKYSGSRKETHTILTYAILRKDYTTIRKVLKVSKEHGVLEDILNKTVTMKYEDGQQGTYTPFDYANEDSETAKIFKEFTDSLTIEHKYTAPVIGEDNATTIENRATVIDEATDRQADDKPHNVATTGKEDATSIIDEAVLIGYEDINSEDLEPIFESSKEAQNVSTEQKPNTSDNPSAAEPCFDSDAAEEKSPTKAMHQRQAILAGSAGVVLLVGSVAFYILKMHVVAVVGVIIGLACIGFALYNALNPNTKLEKVESVKQPLAYFESKDMLKKL
ncbi:WD_0033/WD_0034 family tandem repeat-containing protein [Candidatus Wolbachia massiliensis]|uniref:Uncharacterized protein n=1 Tax=Candidatus Wolbachia massiliensis TaxID=1845000 RepID=A0A7L7YLN6_9RICK|nr:hypothetical protein [Candidatus Wolbachia massiliensis]QOD37978.1 hypothetical protein ID128_03960 [Candidatus Wolbachia massiliensis]